MMRCSGRNLLLLVHITFCGWTIHRTLHLRKKNKFSQPIILGYNIPYMTLLIHPCNKGKHFLCHISDDTNHDAVLTFSVINDIIKRFPQVIAQGVLVIRSDNCEDQYKCRYVFEKMIALAKSMKVFIAWI